MSQKRLNELVILSIETEMAVRNGCKKIYISTISVLISLFFYKQTIEFDLFNENSNSFYNAL